MPRYDPEVDATPYAGAILGRVVLEWVLPDGSRQPHDRHLEDWFFARRIDAGWRLVRSPNQ